MDIKNIIRNITPSVTVMVVGLVGAYFVYNTYFSDRVASGVVGFEPAAGEEVVMTEGMDAVEAVTEGEVTMTSAEEMATDAAEGTVETMTEGAVEDAAEAVEGMAADEEAAADAAKDAVEDAATDAMKDGMKH